MAAIAALAALSCGGCCSSCANNQPTANPAVKTHTGEDLSRTGKRDAGEALRASDSSVTTTTGR